MYETYFDCNWRPFSSTPEPRSYVAVAEFPEIAQRIKATLLDGQGIAMLTAPAGLGKSMLSRRVLYELRESFETVFLSDASFRTRRSLLQAILFEMGHSYSGLPEQELRLELRRAVDNSCGHFQGIAIAVDEAHRLPPRLLDELRVIADLQHDGRSSIRLLLTGQLELEDMLADPELGPLRERMRCHAVIQPLSLKESHDYLNQRLMHAGADPQAVLSEAAATVICRASDGSPRCLNQLADHSLLLAYMSEQKPVAEQTVRDALEDLKQLPLHWNDVPPLCVNLAEASRQSSVGIDESEDELVDDPIEEMLGLPAKQTTAEPQLDEIDQASQHDVLTELDDSMETCSVDDGPTEEIHDSGDAETAAMEFGVEFGGDHEEDASDLEAELAAEIAESSDSPLHESVDVEADAQVVEFSFGSDPEVSAVEETGAEETGAEETDLAAPVEDIGNECVTFEWGGDEESADVLEQTETVDGSGAAEIDEVIAEEHAAEPQAVEAMEETQSFVIEFGDETSNDSIAEMMDVGVESGCSDEVEMRVDEPVESLEEQTVSMESPSMESPTASETRPVTESRQQRRTVFIETEVQDRYARLDSGRAVPADWSTDISVVCQTADADQLEVAAADVSSSETDDRLPMVAETTADLTDNVNQGPHEQWASADATPQFEFDDAELDVSSTERARRSLELIDQMEPMVEAALNEGMDIALPADWADGSEELPGSYRESLQYHGVDEVELARELAAAADELGDMIGDSEHPRGGGLQSFRDMVREEVEREFGEMENLQMDAVEPESVRRPAESKIPRPSPEARGLFSRLRNMQKD